MIYKSLFGVLLIVGVFFLVKPQQDLAVPHTFQSYSVLWGKAGEAWDSTKLPDFTNAGYKGGATVLPIYMAGVNVISFGAVGDGYTDNTAAFKNAIAACAPYQTVFIPSGKYILQDTLLINKNNISLQGDAASPAELFFENGLEQLYPAFDKNGTHRSKWSWSGGVITFKGKNAGMSNIKIVFPDKPWAGHNFHERGYNGVGFANRAQDCWLKNVSVTGADVGVWIDAKASHITIDSFLLDFGPERGAMPISGHHGINIYGSYNLVEHFQIKGQFQHDLTVSGASCAYNVFRSGRGTDICIDHHNFDPSKNLFTDINAGAGSRLYESGGDETPRGICFNETYWNITASANMNYPDEKNDRFLHSRNNICVGIKTNRNSSTSNADGNWFETIDPVNLLPQDLYQAQLTYLGKHE